MKTQILRLSLVLAFVLVASAVLENAVANAMSNPKYRIAILPPDLHNEAHAYTTIINKAINDSFQSESAIDIRSYLSAKKIKVGDRNFNLKTKNLWYKKSFFASRYQPKLDYVNQIGKSLDVDAILMYSIFVGTSATDYIYTYLIDITTNKEYYQTTLTEVFSGLYSGRQEGYAAIVNTTKKVITAFKLDHPLPSMTVVKKPPQVAPPKRVVTAPTEPPKTADQVVLKAPVSTPKRTPQTQPAKPKTTPAKPIQFALTLRVMPPDSQIEFVDTQIRYRQGLALTPGRYTVQVTRQGYKPVRRTVSIKDADVTLSLQLEAHTYALTVNPTPAASTVQILNIGPKYKPGMQLPPGKYDLQVTHDTYITKRQWVEIQDRPVTLDVALVPQPPQIRRYPLLVQTTPKNSTVTLLHADTAYRPNIDLTTGQYEILVEHKGYRSQRQSITIQDQAVQLDVALEREVYAFTIDTVPAESTVRILNITPSYASGMMLPPGRYRVRVEHKGYQPKEKWLSIDASPVHATINLALQTYALTIDTIPRNSAVRLLNIASKYTPGMRLPPGHYDVVLTHAGFIEKRQRVTLSDAPVNILITLTSQTYAFTVKATPKASTVTLLDTDIAYMPGVALPVGHYKALVEHAGYQPKQEGVTIDNQDVIIEVSLTLQRYQLQVKVVPEDSTIILLNSHERFQQGMALKPGKYDLQIARKGYYPLEQSVTLERADVTLDIALEKIAAPVPPADTAAPSIQITSHDLKADLSVLAAVTQATIWGTVRDLSGVSKIMVNGSKTILDQEGNFAATIKLKEGDNAIQVVAEDIHNNTARLAFSIQRTPAPRPSQRRSALIIGNAAYPSSPLQNPSNDAADIAKQLEQLGFKVTLVHDATHRQMEEAVDQFGSQLRQGGVGLFYYAGHGLQVNGQNYLIPTDANLQRELDVKYQAVNAGWVLEIMADSGNELNVAILDACRDNPFARSWRSSQRGLAVVQAARGMFIAYATEPGGVAEDGKGRNGTYTKHLLNYLNKPGWAIEQVFKQVRISVMRETKGKQIPWESSSLLGDFYFLVK